MAEAEIILTQEGRDKLVDELAYREGVKDQEIIERIKTARDFGDLSENSEYDDAKEEQSKNMARINEIRKILATARISDEDLSGVSIGCSVTVKDEDDNELTFKIVGTTETNSIERQISNESPMGAALIGRSEGEEISYVAPSGRTRTFQIIKIVR